MTSAEMRDLTQKVADLVLDRYEGLPAEPAWDGEFRLELEDQLMEDPPEDGRSAEEVFERAARQILPIAARIDHPASLVLSLVTYLAWNTCGFHGGRLPREPMHLADLQRPSQLEIVVIDWFRRWLGYPESAGGLFTSGGSAASVDAFVAAREAAGNSERATVYMSDQSHSAFSRPPWS